MTESSGQRIQIRIIRDKKRYLPPFLNGRAGEIRTPDLLHPMQARYQATLRPEQLRGVNKPDRHP